MRTKYAMRTQREAMPAKKPKDFGTPKKGKDRGRGRNRTRSKSRESNCMEQIETPMVLQMTKKA